MPQLQVRFEQSWGCRKRSNNDWRRNPRAGFGTAVAPIQPARAGPESTLTPAFVKPQQVAGLKGGEKTPGSRGRCEAPHKKDDYRGPRTAFARANPFIDLRSIIFLGGA